MTADKKRVRRITLLFMLTYFVSYVTRVNYGAVLVEMVSVTGYSKALLSIALTGSFITYGIGQIVSGVFGDRFSPKKLVAAGILVSGAMNVLLPFCVFHPYAMAAVWCINGFAQAFLWPPIVRLMTENFDNETYKRSSVLVTYGSSLGTIAVYLVSPLIIMISGFKAVFFVSAAAGALMLPLWLLLAPEGAKKAPVQGEEKTGEQPRESGKGSSILRVLFAPLMLAVMAAIAMQGMLRDGVTAWMPTLVSENFDVGSGTAILTGVILPLFGIVSLMMTSFLYRKKIKNPLTCAAVLFAAGTVSAFALIFAAGRNIVLTVILTALLIASMHGVNLIMTCMIPPFFKKTGKVSTVSGVINACTYVGSAVSTYLIAVISDVYSWTVTLIVWCAIAGAGTLVCFFGALPWKKKYFHTDLPDETGAER